MTTEIRGFFGENRWLSNFWPAEVWIGPQRFGSVEAGYQAAKTRDLRERESFTQMTAGEAKRAGKRIALRHDWEELKETVMIHLLEQKFSVGSPLSQKLLATGNTILIEENSWGDVYWGVCRGQGRNRLGILLMRLRESLL